MRDMKAVLVVIATIGVIIAAAVAGVTLLGGGKKDKPEPTMSGDLDETEKTNEKAVSVDPFDGLEVTFSGISPNAVMNNIDRKTKEGAWVSYTCKPSDGLVLGQKVTVTASLQDTVNYRLKNKEQVYTVEGVDAYITRLSDVTGDVIKKMREKAEAEFTDHTVSRWPSGAKLEGMSYCGMYFLTPKDPASVKDQNKATLVYKVDIQSDRKISCYTYTTFFDLIKKTDGSIAFDINRYEVPQAGSSGDDQISADGIRMAGYTDPERLKKTCVTDQSGYYRCESSVSKLDSLTIPEDDSETETETAEETTEEEDTEDTAVPDTTEEDVDDVVETDKEESDDAAETEEEDPDDVVETDTEEPEVTTKAPETTTKAPETTTIAPETTTESPEITTMASEMTTEAPETTTMAPETTTEAPETTTMAPETTTEMPEITTDEDDTEEIPAVTGTDETGTTAEEPDEEDVEEPDEEDVEELDEEDGEEPDGLTGYDKVLDDYRKALNGDVQDSFRGLPDVQTDPAKTFFYAFYDLNGDGQDELIVTNRLLLREPEEEAVEEPDEEEAEEPDEDVVEEPDEETPEDAEDEEEEEEEIAEEPEEDEEPEAKEPREWDPMTASDPAEVRPDELHVLTMEMPDSGEEEEELLTQARELICDTEDEHYTILSDHTIRCSQAGTDAQYYAVDEFGGLDELSSDPETLSSLKELYFDSSIWKPVLNPDGE